MSDDPLPKNSIYRWEGRYAGQPALVIGNGESRLKFDLAQVPESVTTFGCNALYRDYQSDFIVSVDPNMTIEIPKSGYSGKFIIPDQRFRQYQAYGNKEIELILFDIIRGWSAGPTAVYSALFLGFGPVFILGFDMGFAPREGKINNVYRDTANYRVSDSPPTHWQNWEKQFIRIKNDYPEVDILQLGHQSLRETWAKEASWADLLRLHEEVRL